MWVAVQKAVYMLWHPLQNFVEASVFSQKLNFLRQPPTQILKRLKRLGYTAVAVRSHTNGRGAMATRGVSRVGIRFTSRNWRRRPAMSGSSCVYTFEAKTGRVNCVAQSSAPSQPTTFLGMHPKGLPTWSMYGGFVYSFTEKMGSMLWSASMP